MHQEIDYNLKSEKRDHLRIKTKGKYKIKIPHFRSSWRDVKHSKQTLERDSEDLLSFQSYLTVIKVQKKLV